VTRLLPKYVNSSTGSTVLPSTVTGGPELRFWIFVLVQETRRPNLEASSYCCESGEEAFLLVNEQGDVVSIINVLERMLADLDADSTTDVLHDEIHCSAEPGQFTDP